ncbi:hypothetical protein [Thermomonas sp. S9]|uniref:hypothetical protein n=1 Tax=Thermomonas sp. S9 TaxID=2885203 RepID=UPI00216ACFE1|nr:hypothetical protein [Thermomonas sp. S9]
MLQAAAAREAQGRERNPDLHVVTARGQPPGALPQAIPARILLVGGVALVADQVGLHAQRVDDQLVAAAVVVEGVQEHAHPVVVERAVAVAQVGLDARGIGVFGMEGEVQRVAVVADAHAGFHRRRGVVAGLDVVGDLLHQRALPGGVVELAVDHDRPLQQRDAAAGHGGRRRGGRLSAGAGTGERGAQQQGGDQGMRFQAGHLAGVVNVVLAGMPRAPPRLP